MGRSWWWRQDHAKTGLEMAVCSIKCLAACFMIASALVCAGQAWAQDHLEPDEMGIETQLPLDLIPIMGLDTKFLQSASEVIGQHARVLVVVDAYLSPSWIVGLKHNSEGSTVFGNYVIFGIAKVKGSPPAACQADIDLALANRIIGAWDTVVLQSRFDAGRPRLGADGWTDHFVSRLKYRTIAGRAWVPQTPGNPGWLAQIADGMYRICSKDRSSDKSAMGEIYGALEQIK